MIKDIYGGSNMLKICRLNNEKPNLYLISKEENYFVENEKDLKQKLLSDNNYVQNLSNGEKFQIIREILSDDPESLSKFMNTSFVKKLKPKNRNSF